MYIRQTLRWIIGISLCIGLTSCMSQDEGTPTAIKNTPQKTTIESNVHLPPQAIAPAGTDTLPGENSTSFSRPDGQPTGALGGDDGLSGRQ